MNSNMFKPEKFGHLHLVYNFTIPLNYRKRNSSNKQRHSQSMQQKSVNTNKYGCKINLMSSSGNITKSFICQSIYHWYKECPHRAKVSDKNLVKLSLLSKVVYNCYINKFVTETLNHAVLDKDAAKLFVVYHG